MSEVEYEVVGYGFNFIEVVVNEDGFFVVIVIRVDIRRVFYFVFGVKGRYYVI